MIHISIVRYITMNTLEWTQKDKELHIVADTPHCDIFFSSFLVEEVDDE